MSNVIPLFVSDELAMLADPLRTGDISSFNDILEGIEALAPSDQLVLTEMLIEHALTYSDKALPDNIDIEKLSMLGVAVVGETYDDDSEPIAESQAIVELFEQVSGIDVEQLIAYQEWPAFSEETYSSARSIELQLSALFFGQHVQHGEPSLRLGAAGLIHLDWLVGLTEFDIEIGELRNVQLTVKPHATDPRTNEKPEDHLVFRLNGRVINGSLGDIMVAEGCSRTAIEAVRACNCVKRLE